LTGDPFFKSNPDNRTGEVFETLIEEATFKLERIISKGHATPPGDWYDQDWEEWVILLRGRAGLQFDGETEVRILGPGDYISIPRHCRHRVAWTSPEEETFWLALHFRSSHGEPIAPI
jgi:cupin 2 domain-containing protein